MDAISSSTPLASSQEFGVVAVARRRSADIQIVTAEGDRITLSLSSTQSAGAYKYTAQGKADDGSLTARASGSVYGSASSVSLSVEGDLNKKELHDIHKAIQTVAKIYRDLSKGHEEQALKRASQLDKYDSIAQLSAAVSVSEAALVASNVSVQA